ncbi:MAG: hypothetical protein ABEL04_11300, partial [Salinibacter sp.]
DETLRPVHADGPVDTGYQEVRTGDVAGIHRSAAGLIRGERRVTLDLKMYAGAESSYDAIEVEGEPPTDLRFRGGIFGDTAPVDHAGQHGASCNEGPGRAADHERVAGPSSLRDPPSCDGGPLI